jgi:uncharacterized repeat protein (TIGR01451 family)
MTKTRLSPNPYIPGDEAVFRINITNNGIAPAIVQLTDTRPSDLIQYDSASIGNPTTVVGNTYTWNALTIPTTGLSIIFT